MKTVEDIERVRVERVRERDAQLIQIVDAALADAARRAGAHLVCRPGCTQCCHGAFAITPLDALRLRSGLASLAESDPGRAQAIVNRAERYLAEFGEGFPGDPLTGVLGESPEQQAAFEDFANEAACPALDPDSGRCDLYEARPVACRVFGPPVRMQEETGLEGEVALAVCELCFTEASAEEIRAAEMAVPYALEREAIEAVNTVGTIGALIETQLQAGRRTELQAGETIIAYCLATRPPAPPPSS